MTRTTNLEYLSRIARIQFGADTPGPLSPDHDSSATLARMTREETRVAFSRMDRSHPIAYRGEHVSRGYR